MPTDMAAEASGVYGDGFESVLPATAYSELDDQTLWRHYNYLWIDVMGVQPSNDPRVLADALRLVPKINQAAAADREEYAQALLATGHRIQRGVPMLLSHWHDRGQEAVYIGCVPAHDDFRIGVPPGTDGFFIGVNDTLTIPLEQAISLGADDYFEVEPRVASGVTEIEAVLAYQIALHVDMAKRVEGRLIAGTDETGRPFSPERSRTFWKREIARTKELARAIEAAAAAGVNAGELLSEEDRDFLETRFMRCGKTLGRYPRTAVASALVLATLLMESPAKALAASAG
jgi:hypothetical protein